MLTSTRAGAQRIDVEPSIGGVGRAAAVTVTDRADQPMPGIAVRARSAAGEEVELGFTDARGAVDFRPAVAGRYELWARLPGELQLIALYEVQPPRRRWLWATVCIPVGLVLLWLNVRAVRRRGK